MNTDKSEFNNWPLIAALIIVMTLIVVIYGFKLKISSHDTHIVGQILMGSANDKGWNESHFKGLKEACRKFECNLFVQENVPETKEAVITAINKLEQNGCNIIFLTSFGHGENAEEIAGLYPHISLYSISAKKTGKISVYFERLYQGRYLAGIVAGAASKTGILGFVAGIKNDETCRDINSFALGMKKSNPNARLLVRFTGSWNDEKAERESVWLLSEKGADVISYCQDRPYALNEAENLGLYSIGYDNLYEEYSEKMLTAAICDRSVIYNKILEDCFMGRATKEKSYFMGLSEGAVTLSPMSPLIASDTRGIVEQEKYRITNESDVFSGVIYDNNNEKRCDEGETISDEELFFNMDWLAQGVEVYE